MLEGSLRKNHYRLSRARLYPALNVRTTSQLSCKHRKITACKLLLCIFHAIDAAAQETTRPHLGLGLNSTKLLFSLWCFCTSMPQRRQQHTREPTCHVPAA